jgi:hypothetical protein
MMQGNYPLVEEGSRAKNLKKNPRQTEQAKEANKTKEVKGEPGRQGCQGKPWASMAPLAETCALTRIVAALKQEHRKDKMRRRKRKTGKPMKEQISDTKALMKSNSLSILKTPQSAVTMQCAHKALQPPCCP